MTVEYDIDINKNHNYYKIELYYSSDILYLSITTKDNKYYDKLNTFIFNNGYFDGIQSLYKNDITFLMENDTSEEVKNNIKEKIFTKFSNNLDGKLEIQINKLNEIKNIYNTRLNKYYNRYEQLKNDIGEEQIIKNSDCIIIDNIKNIKHFKKKNEIEILNYESIIKNFQNVSYFARNYIRNQKLNKITNEFKRNQM